MHVGKLLNASVEKGLESRIKSSIIVNDKGVTQDRCDSLFRYMYPKETIGDRRCGLSEHPKGTSSSRSFRLIILQFGCSQISLE